MKLKRIKKRIKHETKEKDIQNNEEEICEKNSINLFHSMKQVLSDIAIANQIRHSHSISSYLAAVTAA
jgi:hypothetical protein